MQRCGFSHSISYQGAVDDRFHYSGAPNVRIITNYLRIESNSDIHHGSVKGDMRVLTHHSNQPVRSESHHGIAVADVRSLIVYSML